MATAAVIIVLASLLPALAAGADSRSPAADYGLALTPSHKCGIVLPVAVGTYDMGTRDATLTGIFYGKFLRG
jgi:hypothetical protein